MPLALQIALLLGFPYLSLKVGQHPRFKEWLSPIILCYALGIILRNFTAIPLDDQISKYFVDGSILLAIPLLLYSTNIFKWLPFTQKALLSFGLCALAAILGTVITYFLMRANMEDTRVIAGMFTGLYIGGTANVQAIGLALASDPQNVILISTADIVVGGIYLLFLTSVARSFFGLFLPRYQDSPNELNEAELSFDNQFNWLESITAIGLTLIVIGTTVGLTYLIFGSLEKNTSFIMLMLTTLGIGASFLPEVKTWTSTFFTAEYLLLIFSVALGMMADFSTILDSGMQFIIFDALILVFALFFHSLFAYFFKIDRDTFLITSVAAFYGTPFVAQVGSMIGNRKVIFSGILMSLLGYMIGNYLGIGLAFVLP